MRRHVGHAFQHFFDRLRKLLCCALFQQVRGGPGPKGLSHEVGVFIHGQKDEFHPRHGLSDQSPRVQPAQLGHGNVQHDHVGPQPLRRFHQRAPICDYTHNFTSGLQHSLERVRQHLVVIRQQYTWALHRTFPPAICDFASALPTLAGRGTSATISVPRIGADRTASFPSTSRSRSRIPISPIPPLASFGAGAKPKPSSATRRTIPPFAPDSSTRACFALLCFTTLFSASWATRKRHRATSFGTFDGAPRSANSTLIPYFSPISPQTPLRAEDRPTSSSLLECS